MKQIKEKNIYILVSIFAILLFLIVSFICTAEFYTENLQIEKDEPESETAENAKEHEGVDPMPEIIDIIIEDDCCTALCEDGTVWAWENIYSRDNLHKISNLNNIIKIVDAGPAMYALSEDGHVYAGGSNEWGQMSVEDRDAYFDEAIQLSGLSDIVDMDVNLDADSEKAKGFCIDENGNFYEW